MSIFSNLLEVGKSLVVGLIDAPLDGRTRVDTLDDIPDIPNPFVGMKIYCRADKKTYTVHSLKAKTIGSVTIENRQIDEYKTDAYSGSENIIINEQNIIDISDKVALKADIPEQNFDYNALGNKPKFIAGDGIKIKIELAESLIVSGAENTECNGTYELADHKKKGTARVWQKSNRKIYHDGTKWLIDSDDDGASFYYSATGTADPWTLTFAAALSEFGNAPTVARATNDSFDKFLISADFSEVIGDINSMLDDINGEVI